MLDTIILFLILAFSVGKWAVAMGILMFLVYQVKHVKKWINDNIEFY